jgi:hypothetical protein
MKEQLITFETAKLAKEKGFDIGTLQSYLSHQNTFCSENIDYNHNKHSNRFSAPTQGLLQKWLREVHNIDVWSQPFVHQSELTGKPCLPDESYSYFIYKDGSWIIDKVDFLDWELALEKGLQEALKLI